MSFNFCFHKWLKTTKSKGNIDRYRKCSKCNQLQMFDDFVLEWVNIS